MKSACTTVIGSVPRCQRDGDPTRAGGAREERLT